LEPIRLLLADDHTLFRKGIRTILEQMQDIEVVGEAATGQEKGQHWHSWKEIGRLRGYPRPRELSNRLRLKALKPWQSIAFCEPLNPLGG